MRAYHDVYSARFEPFDNRRFFGGGIESRHAPDVYAERFHARFYRFVMLGSEYGGGRHKRDLLTLRDHFERDTERDFGFAVTDVAAKQAIHNFALFEVLYSFRRGGELVFRLDVTESVFELGQKRIVGRVRVSAGVEPFAVKVGERERHFVYGFFYAFFDPREFAAADMVKGRFAAGRNVPRQRIHIFDGNVQFVLARVRNERVVVADSAHVEFDDSLHFAHAVNFVNDVIARFGRTEHVALAPPDNFFIVFADEVGRSDNDDFFVIEPRSRAGSFGKDVKSLAFVSFIERDFVVAERFDYRFVTDTLARRKINFVTFALVPDNVRNERAVIAEIRRIEVGAERKNFFGIENTIRTR